MPRFALDRNEIGILEGMQRFTLFRRIANSILQGKRNNGYNLKEM
jgi:hypothetical protein